jgi:phenylpropionate dioxygenase-like ring-hydroxylating dioxygenase large terminal subunit
VELTHVEQGSPMGELLRRYWQPVCLSDELADLPKRVRILSEDLVLFRTKSGKVGCLEPHCSHRGTSLEFGRIEEEGLRCCYHGWLYSPSGRVMEMPCERAGTCERMNVEHPAYPVIEFGGLVFVYMGPADKQPQFPILDVLDTRGRDDVVLRGMRLWGEHALGYVSQCNWLQHFENIVDPWHVIVLHQGISGAQFEGAMMEGRASGIDFDYTPLGVCYRLKKDLPNGNTYIRSAECMVPNVALIPDIRADGDTAGRVQKVTEVSWVVPVDNEHCTALTIVAWPLKDGVPDESFRPGTDTDADYRPGSGWERPYEHRQRKPDDREAQESQRPIAVHALERLVGSDGGVVRLRRLLREQLQRMKEGADPLNVFRDAESSTNVKTTAANTVLAPGEVTGGRPVPEPA